MTDEILGLIETGHNLDNLRFAKQTLENMLAHDSTSFARTLATLLPRQADYDNLESMLSSHSTFFRKISEHTRDIERQLESLNDSTHEMRRQLDTMTAALREIASKKDIDLALQSFGRNMAMRGVPNQLASITLPIFTRDDEKHVDRQSIQAAMFHDFLESDFGLSHLCISSNQPSGPQTIVEGPFSTRPGYIIGDTYTSIPLTDELEILSPSRGPGNIFKFNGYDSPIGKIYGFLRVKCPDQGYYGHVEILIDGTNQHDYDVYLRGHSLILNKFIPRLPSGIQTVRVATTGRGALRPFSRGFIYLHQLEETPNFDASVLNSDDIEKNDLLGLIVQSFTPTRPDVRILGRPSTLQRLIDYAVENPLTLKKIPNNVSSPVRHDVHGYLIDAGCGDYSTALNIIGTRIAAYVQAHFYIPTVSEILRNDDSDDIRELLTLKDNALTGIPKSDHTRLGSIKNRYHYSKETNSTVMGMAYGPERLHAYVCPACGCAYSSTIERQLCNVLDLMFVTLMRFDNGIYPTGLGLVSKNTRDRLPHVDEEVGLYPTDGVLHSSKHLLRVPVDYRVKFPPNMVNFVSGGTFL
jgi:hypothetical protein